MIPPATVQPGRIVAVRLKPVKLAKLLGSLGEGRIRRVTVSTP
jgi:hypothetical protein